jgi:elongation factor Ts
MSVDINLLKQLRDATFAPMKDCKEALVESGGDIDAAIEVLKKKGALQAAKKADRETNE